MFSTYSAIPTVVKGRKKECWKNKIFIGMHMLEKPLLGMMPRDFTLFYSCKMKEIQNPTILLFFS